jgi:hypothetical protein
MSKLANDAGSFYVLFASTEIDCYTVPQSRRVIADVGRFSSLSV